MIVGLTQDEQRARWRERSAAYRQRHPERPGEAVARYKEKYPERVQASQRKHDAKRAEARSHAQRRRLYGVTPDQWAEMSADGCAICGATTGGTGRSGGPKRLSVDHNHDTGAVRGALCDPCNNGIARFDEDSNRLLAAAAYLITHEEVFSFS